MILIGYNGTIQQIKLFLAGANFRDLKNTNGHYDGT